MAHSFVQACGSEREAFRRFAEVFPETTLLVDTYDTLKGVRGVIELARELGPDFKVKGVRLDSGDLHALAVGARALLDEAGLSEVQIFASGGLDERKIAALVDGGAPIDAFGVGTDMSVSADAPALDIAYKLCAYAGEGRLKLSTGKRSLPGRKQVFRSTDGDVIARYEEDLSGDRLLRPVMREGRTISSTRSLKDIRAETAARLKRLPAELRSLSQNPLPIPSGSATRLPPMSRMSFAQSSLGAERAFDQNAGFAHVRQGFRFVVGRDRARRVENDVGLEARAGRVESGGAHTDLERQASDPNAPNAPSGQRGRQSRLIEG